MAALRVPQALQRAVAYAFLVTAIEAGLLALVAWGRLDAQEESFDARLVESALRASQRLLTDTEERTAKLPDEEKKVRSAKEELTRFEKEIQAKKADLEAQLQQAQGQIREVEANLPEELRMNYDRVVAGRGADALAAVKDRTCTACYTEITAQMRNELLQHLYVTCKSCGRYLYLAEG